MLSIWLADLRMLAVKAPGLRQHCPNSPALTSEAGLEPQRQNPLFAFGRRPTPMGPVLPLTAPPAPKMVRPIPSSTNAGAGGDPSQT